VIGDAPSPAHIESTVLMERIDKLPKAFRALVREYGYTIVQALLDDGYKDPFEMAEMLTTWRCRRQEACLLTDYVTKKTAQSIADALQYRMAAHESSNSRPR
jgi:hypothetical protein